MAKGWIAAAVAVLAGISGSAAACSVTPDYFLPTNFELVQLADAIIVARAESGATSPEPGLAVRFATVKPLKGQAPARFRLDGLYLDQVEQSDANELIEANRDAYRGGCIRRTFERGKDYVLFLAREKNGSLAPLGYPFSRTSEDYFGEDSLWVRAIRLYLDVQSKYGPMEQLRRLVGLHDELVDQVGGHASQQIAHDIALHLKFISPYKPTEYLVKTYEALERREDRPFQVKDSGPPSESMFREQDDPRHAVLLSLTVGSHPDAMPLIERLTSEPLVAGRYLGPMVRFVAKNGRFQRAVELSERNALRILASESFDDAAEFERSIPDIGDTYDARGDLVLNPAPDPYWAKAWPEFEFAAYSLFRSRFGAGYARLPRAAALRLRPKDYRERPDLAIALVRQYDHAVIDWAERELFAKAPGSKDAEFAELPIRILVEHYFRTTEPPLERAFCQSPTRRKLVIAAIGQSGTPWAADLARRIGAYKALTDEERDQLVHSLIALIGPKLDPQRAGLGGYPYDREDEYALLLGLIKHEEIPLEGPWRRVEPIECR